MTRWWLKFNRTMWRPEAEGRLVSAAPSVTDNQTRDVTDVTSPKGLCHVRHARRYAKT
jgi:hypothetical protein